MGGSSAAQRVRSFPIAVAVAAALTPHVAFLIVGRAHFLADEDRDTSGVVRRGVSSVVLRAGVGVLVRF